MFPKSVLYGTSRETDSAGFSNTDVAAMRGGALHGLLPGYNAKTKASLSRS
jgi:hypothetical protein